MEMGRIYIGEHPVLLQSTVSRHYHILPWHNPSDLKSKVTVVINTKSGSQTAGANSLLTEENLADANQTSNQVI